MNCIIFSLGLKKKVFGNEVYKELAGGGGFASVEQIAIVGPKSTFPKVRILGPCRRQSQVELSKTDARALGVDAPVRISGDLEGTPGIKLVGPAGELELKQGVIVAKRHIHIGKKQVEEWGLNTGDIVAVRVVSSAYLRLLIFLLAILIPACCSSSAAFCMMYFA